MRTRMNETYKNDGTNIRFETINSSASNNLTLLSDSLESRHLKLVDEKYVAMNLTIRRKVTRVRNLRGKKIQNSNCFD